MEDSTEEHRQAKNLLYLRQEVKRDDHPRKGDQLVINGQTLTTSLVIDREACDQMGHDSGTRLAETCGACDESPQLKPGSRETGGSNPSRLHELTGRWERLVMENGFAVYQSSTSR